MDSLCHPWFTTTNLSYRFPIFETSATALCGTTGTSNYPLVNVYRKLWKITMLSMGKSTISMVIFNSKLLVITRGYCYFLPRFGTVSSGPDFSSVTLDLSDACAMSSSQAALSKWQNFWFSFWFRDATLPPLYLWKIIETLIIDHVEKIFETLIIDHFEQIFETLIS